MAAHALIGDGLGVALATPFAQDGEVDLAAMGRLTESVVEGGADFVVALGSTGEASMLTDCERALVVETVRQHCGNARLVVGAGAASTDQACSLVLAAAVAGADAALVAVPSYTRPTQDGIYAHFDCVADVAPSLPLIAYNVPSRTGAELRPETLTRLWRIPSIVAIKESSGDLLQIARIAAEMPSERALLAGDDALLLPTVAVGGHGVVSVAANIVPQAMCDLLAAVRRSDLCDAQRKQVALMPLFDALSREPNPIAIKAAIAHAGFGCATPRLPLTPATAVTREAIETALLNLRQLISHA